MQSTIATDSLKSYKVSQLFELYHRQKKSAYLN